MNKVDRMEELKGVLSPREFHCLKLGLSHMRLSLFAELAAPQTLIDDELRLCHRHTKAAVAAFRRERREP